MMRAISKKRLDRIDDLVSFLNQHKDGLRYDLLNNFARRHGVSYEVVKRDALLLAYATIPSHRGYNLKYVPKEYRKEVRWLWKEIFGIRGGKKKMDRAAAWRASHVFLEHTPYMDLERVKREFDLKQMLGGEFYQKNIDWLSEEEAQIHEMQREMARELKKISEESKAELEEHMVRKYSDAWLVMGRKIHKELAELKKAKERGAFRDEIEYLQAIKDIWRANLYEVKASKDYEAFRTNLLKALRKEFKIQHKAVVKKGANPKKQSTPLSSLFFKALRETPFPKEAKYDEEARKMWLTKLNQNFEKLKRQSLKEIVLKGKSKIDSRERLFKDMKFMMRRYRPGKKGNIPVHMSDQIRVLAEAYAENPKKLLSSLSSVPKDNFFKLIVKEGMKISEADYYYNRAMRVRSRIPVKTLLPRSIRKGRRH
ncbi:hypothetical protein DRN74_03535 [Candidatus Micrarchaeota archaeon]|nr:MAG: hypothetical protein DRN74_03535 [Candidatus Micrarchaeota archaeon]